MKNPIINYIEGEFSADLALNNSKQGYNVRQITIEQLEQLELKVNYK